MDKMRDTALKDVAEREFVELIVKLVQQEESLKKSPFTLLAFNEMLHEHLMDTDGDYAGRSMPSTYHSNTVSKLRAKLKEQGLCFFDLKKGSTAQLTGKAKRIASEAPKPVAQPVVALTLVPDPLPAPVPVVEVSACEPVPQLTEAPAVKPEPIARIEPEPGQIHPEVHVEPVVQEPEPVTQKGGVSNPAQAVDPTPIVDPIPAPVSTEWLGELIAFPAERVTPPRPKVPPVFAVPGQSNRDTYLANQRLLNERFGGNTPSKPSRDLCCSHWPRSNNPFSARSSLKADGYMGSTHRWRVSGDDWFTTPKANQYLDAHGIRPSLTEEQADDLIHARGYETAYVVPALHARLAEIEALLEPLFSALDLDPTGAELEKLEEQVYELEREQEKLNLRLCDRPVSAVL